VVFSWKLLRDLRTQRWWKGGHLWPRNAALACSLF
jgi:hypothetical protein